LGGSLNENVKNVLFKSEIGQSNTTSIKLQSFLLKQMSYTVKIVNQDGDNFFLENGTMVGTLNVGPATVSNGLDFFCPVKFDPSILGECKANLEVSDKEIGTIQVKLRGIAEKPQPKGPIYTPTGKATI